MAQDPDTTTEEASDNGDMRLWGLAGLLGLAGLAGLNRPDRDTYDNRYPRVNTRT